MDTSLIIVLVVLFALLFLEIPVAFALAGSGLLGLFLIEGVQGLEIAANVPWNHTYSYPLAAIPMFVLMGQFLIGSTAVQRLFITINIWMGRIPGSLGIGTTLACGIFAACSGSGTASTATMGQVAYPELKRHGYDSRVAAGLLASGGSLGPVIPPSALLIIYAATVGLSIGQLFMAAFIPGIILIGLLSGFVMFLGLFFPKLVPRAEIRRATWREKLISLRDLLPLVFLILVVLGSIYTGWMTANEAAAAGVAGALIVRLAFRDFSRRDFLNALKGTLFTTCFVLLILAGANILSTYLIFLGVPQLLQEFIVGLEIATWELATIVIVLYLILGMFLDPVSMVLVTVPVLLPLMEAFGYSAIWFGIVVTLLAEIGTLTPPVGLHLYVIQGVTGLSLQDIVKGVAPFIVVWLAVVILIWAFPSLTLWLPSIMIN